MIRMGFSVEPPDYKLIFAEPEFDGLEVRARSVSVAKAIRLGNIMRNVSIAPFPDDDEKERIEEAAEIFAQSLVSWNLEIDDEPVPPTAQGLMSLPLKLFWKIQGAWLSAISGVTGPLESSSDGGNPSLEESMPMESLS